MAIRETPVSKPASTVNMERVQAIANGIFTLWYRDLLRYLRDRSRIIASMAQPILFLGIFGAGLSPSMGDFGGSGSDLDYTQFLFPGIITMAVLFTAIFSAVSIIYDREFGFLKEVLVAPLPRWAIAVGKALGGSTVAVIQGALMLIFAPLVGVSLTPLILIELVPLMLLIAVSLNAMGLLIASRMKSMEGFQLIMNFLLLPMLFLSGTFFPLDDLPGWLTVITRLNPVTYGVDAIRQVVLGGESLSPGATDQIKFEVLGITMTPVLDMLVVCGFGVIMVALAVRAFAARD